MQMNVTKALIWTNIGVKQKHKVPKYFTMLILRDLNYIVAEHNIISVIDGT